MTDGREDSEDILRFLASNVESIHDKVGGIENRLGGIETRIGRVEDHMATKEERNCLPLWVDQGDGGVVGSTKD